MKIKLNFIKLLFQIIVFLWFGTHMLFSQNMMNEELDTIIETSDNKIDTVKIQDSIADFEIVIQPKTFEANFKEKYRDGEFVYEAKLEKGASWWTRMKEKMARLFDSIFDFNNNVDSMDLVDTILEVLAVIVILVVIYLITKSILNKEGQWIFGKSSSKSILRFEDVEKNIHQIDFEKLIQETLSQGNERLAIRYYYLWVLRKLSDQKIITWDLEKTNSDYLYEIKDDELRANYAYLSYLYNNIWYGEFEFTENMFQNAQKSFVQTLKTLRK